MHNRGCPRVSCDEVLKKCITSKIKRLQATKRGNLSEIMLIRSSVFVSFQCRHQENRLLRFVSEEPFNYCLLKNLWKRSKYFVHYCRVLYHYATGAIELPSFCSFRFGYPDPHYLQVFNELEKILQQRELVDPVSRRPWHWKINCMQRGNFTIRIIVICPAYPTTID